MREKYLRLNDDYPGSSGASSPAVGLRRGLMIGLGIAGGRFPEVVAVACRWHSGLADLARCLFPGVYVDKRYTSGGRTHLGCRGWMAMLANLSALFSGS